IPDAMAGVQAARALATALRDEIDNHVHAVVGHQHPMAARMPPLAARRAATPYTTSAGPLTTGESIGGRRLGRPGGILLAQGQLAFQIGDPFRLLGQLLTEPLVLPPPALHPPALPCTPPRL